jgi:LmbE family N-acetylglucosaminyl deacetylase
LNGFDVDFREFREMLQVKLAHNESALQEFLFIGAHCDDIEIGCGGTVLRLIKEYPHAFFRWVTLSSTEKRAIEGYRSADIFLSATKRKQVLFKNFRNGYFPYSGAEIKDFFENLKKGSKPDVIFTHWGSDLHQDHRFLSELTWNTFRNHVIFEYEIPKYDGGLGSPNVFFPLTKGECETKTRILFECFESEQVKPWFSEDVFLGLMRLRGVECNAHSGYAEAFYCRKAVF